MTRPGYGRAGRLAGLCAVYIAPVILLLVIAIGVGYVRLRHGPISLRVFVAPIENGISAGLGGMTAKVEDALLSLGEGGGLEFRLSNLTLSEKDGDLVASAPLAAIELSPGSFWSLRVEPSRVFLIEPRVSLNYSRQDGLKVSITNPVMPGDGSLDGSAQSPSQASRTGDGTAEAPRPEGPAKQVEFDFTRIFSESASRARSGEDATSNLREIGVRNAVVSLDYEGTKSEWQVAEAGIDLEHRKKRSVVSGSAKISSGRGPWSLSFRAEDSEKTGDIKIQASVRDLVPQSLAAALPALSFLGIMELPVAADASIEVSHDGKPGNATAAIELGSGGIRLASLGPTPSRVEAGLINLNYNAAKRTVTMRPSTLKSGESFVTLSGVAAEVLAEGSPSVWQFDLKSDDGVLAAEEFGVPGKKIDAFTASGAYVPGDGSFRLSRLEFKSGEASISAQGELAPNSQGRATQFEGKLSPMPVDLLKVLWPRAVAAGARDWVGKNLTGGRVQSGTLRFASGQGQTANPEQNSSSATDRLSLAIELADLKSAAGTEAVSFEIPRALLRLEGDALEVNVPDAAISTGTSQLIAVKSGRFTAVAMSGQQPIGEAVFRVQSPLSAVLTGLTRQPLAMLKEGDLPLEALDGKVDGQFTVKLPLGEVRAAGAVKVEGKARISDIKSKQKFGSLELQGGTINVDVTEEAVDAKGELLLNGVLAKVFWQRLLDADDDKQPPLRLMATLDNADRNQVGLDVNHFVQGDMSLEATVARGTNAVPAVHVRADLTNAELTFEDLAWVKPPGRAAVLDFDVAKGQINPLELHNIKMVGDNIAIEGWASLDAKNDMREFFFPDFSLNVVSRLEVQGRLGNDRIWRVKAHGATYDAKDLFTALVSLGGPQERGIKPLRPAAGMELEANVSNLLGHNETSLRGVNIKVSQRAQKLTALDVDGKVDGGKPFAALLKPTASGQRVIYVDSTDAGQIFKLANFYPNVQGGRIRLEVNLDGKGAAARTGILWVEKFRVLGDPVISEVISSADGKQGSASRNVVREVYDFDILRAPFSAGHEQFLLEDSQLRGPIVGATIAGKVDFRARSLSLGGTYIPLQGINSALCAIPLLGMIITGPKCDGVVGITYAIQGSMSRPQVIVNPLSMFTPGILKEIMQMTNPNQQIQARDGAPKTPASERVGKSSSEAVRAGGAGVPPAGGSAAAQSIDGWTSPQPGSSKN